MQFAQVAAKVQELVQVYLETIGFWGTHCRIVIFPMRKQPNDGDATAASLRSVIGALAHHSHEGDPLPESKMAILGRKMIDFKSSQKHIPTCLEGVWRYLSDKIVIIIVVETAGCPTILWSLYLPSILQDEGIARTCHPKCPARGRCSSNPIRIGKNVFWRD